jgi:hypothetical protein
LVNFLVGRQNKIHHYPGIFKSSSKMYGDPCPEGISQSSSSNEFASPEGILSPALRAFLNPKWILPYDMTKMQKPSLSPPVKYPHIFH